MTKNNEFDYQNYEKNLCKILELSEKDYWNQYVSINSYQVSVAKTYLWISAAQLGAYVAVYDRYSSSIMQSGFTLLLAFLSLITVIFAFGLCVYAIPARKGYKAIPEVSWGEFSQSSYEYLEAKQENSHIHILSSIIDRIDSATSHNINTNQKRAKQLRIISWVLIASFSLAVTTAATSTLNHYISIVGSHNDKGNAMTENKSNDNTVQETAQATPNVPKPQGPITSQKKEVSPGRTLFTNKKDNIRFVDHAISKDSKQQE